MSLHNFPLVLKKPLNQFGVSNLNKAAQNQVVAQGLLGRGGAAKPSPCPTCRFYTPKFRLVWLNQSNILWVWLALSPLHLGLKSQFEALWCCALSMSRIPTFFLHPCEMFLAISWPTRIYITIWYVNYTAQQLKTFYLHPWKQIKPLLSCRSAVISSNISIGADWSS